MKRVIAELPHSNVHKQTRRHEPCSPAGRQQASAGEVLMPLKSFSRGSLFDPQTISPACLEPGRVPWLLSKLGRSLVPRFLAAEWRGAGLAGRNAWPASVLMALQLLRWAEGGGSRLGACRRARTDLAWRAAMGLPAYGGTPTEKTVREFERWLMECSPSCDLPRYIVVMQRVVHFVEWGAPAERLWMMDSTPMLCFGALRGTVRLLGDGLRSLVGRWARINKTSKARVAREWEVLWVTARSTKGGLCADWRDAQARHDVVHRLGHDVLRVVGEVLDQVHEVPPQYREELQRRCRLLLKVIVDDLETDASGRLIVARNRVTRGRLVSITEPDARSGRKSNNHPFKGYKLSVFGDLVSGLIAAVTVVQGNAGDAAPGHELLRQVQAMDLRVDRVLADSAFGGTEDRLMVRSMGIELVAPPSAQPKENMDFIQKHHFGIDFDQHIATCPDDVETTQHRMVRREGKDCVQFEWPIDACMACPLREYCVPKLKTTNLKGRRLVLHPEEGELRAARATWSEPARTKEYRRRGEGELLIAKMVRYGARQARAFGLAAANLQANCVAMAANLALLARVLADRIDPRPPDPLPLFPDSS